MAANDFLVSKWKIWYKSLDVNHDGTISMADVEESRNKFSELHHLEADKKKLVMDNFEKWWNEYIFRGQSGEISEQQFVEVLNKDFMANKAAFCAKMEKCFNEIFDVIDTNKDRSISEEEFLIAFKAYGHENVALDTKFFKAYNPKEGLVPLKDIVSSWVDFATSTDSSKASVVKEAFEAGMANDHLTSKWKIWYKALDVNHDGKISKEDVEEQRARFSELHHLDADKKKIVEDNFEKWWNEFIFRGQTGEISESQFVDCLNKDFTSNKGKFVENMRNCFAMMFDVIDTNKDRSISEEEFLIAFRAYGHENVALDTKFFKAYNPTEGLVPIKVIVDSWVDFVTSEDSSKADVVKTAFETGV